MIKNEPSLMVISHAFAPYASGSAVLLANLLEEYKGRCMAISGFSRHMKADKDFVSPCPVVTLNPPKSKLFEMGFARFINSNRWFVRAFFQKHIDRFKPDAILGVFPHSTFFIAAYEVAKKNGIPFYAHMHDLWQENYPDGYYAKKLADKYEALILKDATKVFCMTQTQADHYHNKYGIDPLVLPHTIKHEALTDLKYMPVEKNNLKILFGGALSSVMNADALAVFSKSKRFLKHPSVSYNFFTNAEIAQLQEAGVDTDAISKKWVSRKELAEELKSSHILFAPLSHKNCSALEVKTVFSTKLLEYLVSGRPILLFAPADSFHVTSARRNNWALVVDEDKPEAIAAAIDRLIDDEALCRQLVEGAFKEAKERDAAIFAEQLYNHIVQEATAQPRPAR